MATLFDRLGGAPAIEKAVDVFYNKVMADHRINHWFSHMDMHAQRKKQSTFLTTALGGPSTYSGRDMAAAHQALVDRGLGDADFDAVVENLASTLTELGIDASLIGEVATLLESQRDTVLCRTGNPLIHSVFSDGVLRADQWSKFRLVARSDLAPATNGSPGTILLTFAVAGEQPTVFAPGQHVQVGAEINGRWVLRNYTPMPPYERPEIKLAVKVYPNGAMSSHLAALPIGAAVELRGPRGHYTYQRGSVGRANMLACGSGVMPVYQLLHAVAAESDAHMPARILYANRNEEVAILKEELSSLVHTRPHFELQYYLTHPTDRCRVKYLPHRIDSASIASSCFEPDATTCNFISGTDDFVRSMRDILTEQGHRPESIVIF